MKVVKSEYVDCVVKNVRPRGLSSGGATEAGKVVDVIGHVIMHYRYNCSQRCSPAQFVLFSHPAQLYLLFTTPIVVPVVGGIQPWLTGAPIDPTLFVLSVQELVAVNRKTPAK